VGAAREAPECRLVVLAGTRVCHRVGCRLHPRNMHSRECGLVSEIYTPIPTSTVQHTDFSLDTTWGTDDNTVVALPRRTTADAVRPHPGGCPQPLATASAKANSYQLLFRKFEADCARGIRTTEDRCLR